MCRVGLFIVLVLLAAPMEALANFVWPPMLYVYTYTVWWVVVGGLLVECVVYFFAWHRGWWGTLLLTIALNVTSAVAGAIFSIGSLLFVVDNPTVLVSFLYASPVLVFAMTVAAEYAAGTFLFSLPRSWKTVGVIAAANVPSVGLALYETGVLTGKALG